MRPLTEPETKTLFDKLANYTGSSLKNLIAPLDDSPDADRYVFRLHKDRVYYVLLSIANLATSISRENLSSLGVCLGTTFPTTSLPPSSSLCSTPTLLRLYGQLSLPYPKSLIPVANIEKTPNRQVHEIRQVPTARNGAVDPRRARAIQDLDPQQRGDAAPVRRQRRQGPRGALHRGHARAPGRRDPQHGRQAAWFRCYCGMFVISIPTWVVFIYFILWWLIG